MNLIKAKNLQDLTTNLNKQVMCLLNFWYLFTDFQNVLILVN